MSEATKPAKATTTRGPQATRLKIKGDWKDAIKASFRKKITKKLPK
jgi:hypothetical protein